MISIPIQIHREPFTTTACFGDSLAEMSRLHLSGTADVRLIADEAVWLLHAEKLLELPGMHSDKVTIVPSGESSKSLAQYSQICEALTGSGIRRNTKIYVAGGGVTGDLGGFVAASLLRGLPYVQIPTTVLAMVDSAFGGKTGVNTSAGKNLVGAFYQPDAILCDVSFLKTLPEPEWNNGLGEILKYGLISKPEILQLDWTRVRGDDALLSGLISTCAKQKIDIVQRDEHETGERAFLNLGHTFGHALETVTGYARFKHGEAVFAGLLAALFVSKAKGAPVDPSVLERFKPFFTLGCKDLLTKIPALMKAMKADKKNRTDGVINLVLLQDYGVPYVYAESDSDLIHSAWEFSLLTC